MKKQKEKITDASTIGRNLGGNIVGYIILFCLLTFIIIMALSLSIFPSLLTSDAPDSSDFSGFVTAYSNTLILSILTIVLGLLGIFFAHVISFKSIKKKTTIYKNNVGTIKTTALIIVGIYLLIVCVNGFKSVFDNHQDYVTRKNIIDSSLETFNEINPDELTSLDLYVLGVDSIDEYKEKVDPIISNLEKTSSIISLLIIVNFVDTISFIALNVILLLLIPKKLNMLAVDEPSFENDLYGNVITEPTSNTFNSEQSFNNTTPYDFNLYN